MAKQLAERGASQNLSVGEFARRIVLDALSDSTNEQTREDLAELREQIQHLREDHATATAALLVDAGKISQSEAEAWVRRSLYQ